MPVTIKVEITAGSEIRHAAAECQRIADLLGAFVQFKFNGVECVAVVGGDADTLAERQQDMQSAEPSPFLHRFVTSRQTPVSADTPA